MIIKSLTPNPFPQCSPPPGLLPQGEGANSEESDFCITVPPFFRIPAKAIFCSPSQTVWPTKVAANFDAAAQRLLPHTPRQNLLFRWLAPVEHTPGATRFSARAPDLHVNLAGKGDERKCAAGPQGSRNDGTNMRYKALSPSFPAGG